MSASGEGGGGGDRRQKSNLEGVLKFCLENTKSEDASGQQAAFSQMSEERRQFLEQVLGSLGGRDPVKAMLEAVRVVVTPGDSEDDLQAKEMAMEDLLMHCEDLDLANDFHKVGGYQLFPVLLACPEAGLRWRCGELVATLAQNNPYSQEKLLEEPGLMATLLRTLDSDPDNTVRVKALYALSCLSRGCAKGEEEFVKQDGFSHLIRAMQTDIDKLQLKAAFMLTSLCVESPQNIAPLVASGVPEELIGLLSGPHAAHHEHLTRALLVLAQGSPEGAAACRTHQLQLRPLLEARRTALTGQEECQEELEYIQKLLEVCFPAGQSEVER